MFFHGKLGDTVSFNYRHSTSGRFERRVVRVVVLVDNRKRYALQEDGSIESATTDNADRIGGYVVSEGPTIFKSFRLDRVIGNVRLVKRTIV